MFEWWPIYPHWLVPQMSPPVGLLAGEEKIEQSYLPFEMVSLVWRIAVSKHPKDSSMTTGEVHRGVRWHSGLVLPSLMTVVIFPMTVKEWIPDTTLGNPGLK